MYGKEAIKLRIDELCKKKNLSYYQLANLSGLTLSTLMNIVNEKSLNPTIVTIYKICMGFSITVSEFFTCEYFDIDFIIEEE